MRIRKIIAVNLLLSALTVFLWIGYAKLTGLPMDEHCMGFRRDWRFPYFAAWVAPLMIEAGVLVLFCFRSLIGEGKVRFFIGGFSAFSLLFVLVLPILLEQVYGTKSSSSDQALWCYVCFSNVAYGLVGSPSSDA